jgi:HSP20 family protein
MGRLFEDVLQDWPLDLAGTAVWYPVSDIYETEDELIVKADLPGVDPMMVDVRLENNVLTIRGERQFEQNIEKENYHRLERSYGSFCRSFALPTVVEADKIRADFKDGVLSITLPKAESVKAKRIQIAAAAA